MQTPVTAFVHFTVTVNCRCPGPEHGPDCDREENQHRAADAALKEGVSAEHDDFVEGEGG